MFRNTFLGTLLAPDRSSRGVQQLLDEQRLDHHIGRVERCHGYCIGRP